MGDIYTSYNPSDIAKARKLNQKGFVKTMTDKMGDMPNFNDPKLDKLINK